MTPTTAPSSRAQPETRRQAGTRRTIRAGCPRRRGRSLRLARACGRWNGSPVDTSFMVAAGGHATRRGPHRPWHGGGV